MRTRTSLAAAAAQLPVARRSRPPGAGPSVVCGVYTAVVAAAEAVPCSVVEARLQHGHTHSLYRETLQTPGMRMYWENNWYLRFIVLVTTARLVTAGGTHNL